MELCYNLLLTQRVYTTIYDYFKYVVILILMQY